MIAAAAAAAVLIAGTPQQGQRLVAAGAPAGSTYQWYRCAADVSHCSSIHGATGAGYTLAARDVGSTFALTVKTGAATVYAAAVGPVAAKGATLVPTAQPAIAGAPVAGEQLAVDTGTWSTAATGTTYDWLRCNANGRICMTIANATGATYTPTAADVGHALAVRVTASAGRVAQPALSTTTAAVVAAGPTPSATPTIGGTAQQGQRLAVSPVTWTGSGTVAVSYQWYRCDALVSHCSSVHGATGAGYVLGADDVGHTVTLTITAKDGVATTTVYVSAVGQVVAKGAAAPAQPTLSGSATLTVAGGGAPYAWLRCNANGRACVAIAGATAATYTPTAAEAGHTLVATAGGALSPRSAVVS